MAKKNKKNVKEEVLAEVRSRRDFLRDQKEQSQRQYVRRIALAVVGLLAVVLIVGVVVEYLIVPRQAVATIGDERVTLSQWQTMVRYQRARLIMGLEEQYELFADPEVEGSDVQAIGYVQQFSGQQIALLTNAYQFLGEFVLEQLVSDALIRQGAAERGLTVSQAEIDEVIGEQFNYYGGGLPTPAPTASPSPEPTPSITPLPTFTPEGFVLTETETVTDTLVPTVEAEPTAVLPTSTPLPTATPVSEQSFQDEFDELTNDLRSLRVNTDLFRYEVEMSLYREKLADALFIEQEIDSDAEHASAFFLLAYTEAEANELMAMVADKGFLTVWNELRSNPAVAADPTLQPPTAQELLWRTAEEYRNFFPSGTVADAIFSLPPDQPSDLLLDSATDGSSLWLIVQVSGRETRPLSEEALSQKKQETLQAWIEEQRASQVVQFENWRNRVPRQPILDTKFTQTVPAN